jgi:hypothetical protein
LISTDPMESGRPSSNCSWRLRRIFSMKLNVRTLTGEQGD